MTVLQTASLTFFLCFLCFFLSLSFFFRSFFRFRFFDFFFFAPDAEDEESEDESELSPDPEPGGSACCCWNGYRSSATTRLKDVSPSESSSVEISQSSQVQWACLAVGEAVILLLPPLHSVGMSIGMGREPIKMTVSPTARRAGCRLRRTQRAPASGSRNRAIRLPPSRVGQQPAIGMAAEAL